MTLGCVTASASAGWSGVLLAACAADGPLTSTPDHNASGMQIRAQQDVLVSNEPFGDVLLGDGLQTGDTVTAVCFVKTARTMTGQIGSAVKVENGGVVGFAAVTDFPEDPADRQLLFDVDEDTLASQLPTCTSVVSSPTAARSPSGKSSPPGGGHPLATPQNGRVLARDWVHAGVPFGRTYVARAPGVSEPPVGMPMCARPRGFERPRCLGGMSTVGHLSVRVVAH